MKEQQSYKPKPLSLETTTTELEVNDSDLRDRVDCDYGI